MTNEYLISIRDWLRHFVSSMNNADLVFGHGTNNAMDEAVYLITDTLAIPAEQLEIFLDARLSPDEKKRLQDILQQRTETRLPAPYITGKAWLTGYAFKSDPRAIVPRSFIAEMLQEACAPWIEDPDNIHTALDLCTGSGCLAIIMAHVFKNAQIDAVDISPEALQLATENIHQYQLDGQIQLIRSDLFDAIPHDKKYDLIISNPPYVTEESMQALPPEYQHEPAIALGSGILGLDCIERILTQAAQYLTSQGQLFVEVGHNRAIVDAAFPQYPLTWISTTSSEDRLFYIERDALLSAQH